MKCPPFPLSPLAAMLGLMVALPVAAQSPAPESAVVPGVVAPKEKAARLPSVITKALREQAASNYTIQNASSATGLDLSLRETPQSISVVTSRQISEQASHTVDETMARLPGVYRQTWGSPSSGYNTFMSRGYSIDNYLIDDANMQSLANTQALNNVDSAIYESVNLVRGATGVISGTGEPGGVIELIRKKPTAERRVSVEAGAGSWKHYRTVVDASGALNESRSLRGRLVAALDDGGEWQRGAKQHRGSFWGVVEHDLTPSTVLTVGLQHDQSRTTGSAMHSFEAYYGDDQGGYHLMPFGARDNAAARWSFRNARRTELSTRLEHELDSGWQFNVRYSYVDGRSEQLYGIAGTYNVRASGAARLAAGHWERAPKEHLLDVSLRGTYPLLGRHHDVKLGFNHNQLDDFDNPQSEREFVSVPNLFAYTGDIAQPAFPERGHGGDKSRMTSIYAVTNLSLTDRWSVLVGSRLVRWDAQSRQIYTNFRLEEQKESSIFTPYLGSVYALNDWLSVYGSYSTIFKPQSAVDVDYRRLDPEEGRQIEAGLKGEWFGGKLNGTATFFDIRKDNLAQSAGRREDGTAYFQAVDGGKTRGWELMLSGEVQPGWVLSAGYAHARSKDASGTRINRERPASMMQLNTSWDIDDRWTVGGGMRWQSEMLDSRIDEKSRGKPALVREALTQKSYGVVDLMASYRFSRQLGLRLNVGNVLGKKYLTAPGSLGFGAPRHAMLTLKYDF